MEPFKRKEEAITALCVAVLCAVGILYAGRYGTHARSFAGTPVAEAVAYPHQAVEIWERSGARGRTLLLLDRHLNADDESKSPDERYVHEAIQRNIVRRVFHVVPDAAWHEVEKVLTGNDAFEPDRGFYRMVYKAVPVTVLRLRDVPVLDEPVLLAVNGNHFDDQGLQAAANLLERGVVRTDVIVWSGRTLPLEMMNRLGFHEPINN